MDDNRMDGFVINAAQTTSTDGHWAMGEYTAQELPFYYFLGTTYAVADRHFAPMPTGTYANRNFLMFGSNAGVIDTGIVFAQPNTPSIMALLSNAGFTWAFYVDGAGSQPASGALNWSNTDPGVHPLSELLSDMDNGTLPNVAFVDGKENIEDDHPDADLQVGEAWSRNIYQHLVASPQWMRSAMFFTYDEAGAFADHVVPSEACKLSENWPWPQMGPRVPFVAVSPWARRSYASHVVRDHTAMTRFIELLFHLPALTPRDANSDALLDLFDFSCGRDLAIPAAPDAGTGACVDPAPPGTD
jgi:phospholipase C